MYQQNTSLIIEFLEALPRGQRKVKKTCGFHMHQNVYF
jgi:hypothetical protein